MRLWILAIGDTLVVYPHDICPVDGVVIEGQGMMDESFLTGEPFKITKSRTSPRAISEKRLNGFRIRIRPAVRVTILERLRFEDPRSRLLFRSRPQFRGQPLGFA